jgi:hypothetical protein
MPYLTGKHVPRRTFLQGMGAAVALPFLDAMVPAGMGTAAKAAAAEATGPRDWSARGSAAGWHNGHRAHEVPLRA